MCSCGSRYRRATVAAQSQQQMGVVARQTASPDPAGEQVVQKTAAKYHRGIRRGYKIPKPPV